MSYMQTILFDGYCNLCSSSVRFIRRRNSAASFHFIPLQSEAGQRLLQKNGINIKENSTVVYIKDNRYFLRSSAFLHICKDLGKGWQFTIAWYRSLRLSATPFTPCWPVYDTGYGADATVVSYHLHHPDRNSKY